MAEDKTSPRPKNASDLIGENLWRGRIFPVGLGPGEHTLAVLTTNSDGTPGPFFFRRDYETEAEFRARTGYDPAMTRPR